MIPAYARHYHPQRARALRPPRKFNVAFDSAGTIAVLEDANASASRRSRVKDGFASRPASGSVSRRRHHRHKDFATPGSS